MLILEGLKVAQGGFHLTGDLSVVAGEVTAVIGPSGGGKSTLLSTIAGFITPQSGRVIWDGVDLTEMTPGARPVSLVFQDNNLFPHFTAFENVAIGVRPDMRLNEADKARVTTALERVGLQGLEVRKPAALSGGQQSRVALARVLVRGKPLLLLDEPFAALGPALRAEMLVLVAELARDSGATMLMVTHDPADAMRIAGQTIFVDVGVVHAPVETGELFADPPEALRGYLGR